VYLNAGREHAVASTKAFTTQVTALALIAGWFSQNRSVVPLLGNGKDSHNLQRRNEMLEAVSRLPTYAGIALRTHEQCKKIAEKLKDAQHMFILGKGFAEPIAYEGALKIKEITYLHAEGYPGGALKHGPFALLDKGTPVILMVFDDQHAELMRIAAAEVKARNAYTVVITDKKQLAEGIADEVITIPSNGPMTAMLGVIPLQLLAYEIAIRRGFNPDKPRNLAKAVTVD
jgi:glucosamine--fructose-6-phosphate aminotransferase (isomerizing)